MAEVLFYHLTGRSMEQVLPDLLEKCLQRGWRAVVQAGSRERLEALDAHLWTWREESFLPHGMFQDGTQALQPIWLTDGTDNPNGAQVRFMVEGALPPPLDSYLRGIYLFDGHDAGAVQVARERWQAERQSGHEVTYWQQGETGRWQRKA